MNLSGFFGALFGSTPAPARAPAAPSMILHPFRGERIDKIVMHWTAGGHRPNSVDLGAYHYVIDGAGVVHLGRYHPEAQKPPLDGGRYAAHARGFNSYALGVSLAAMAGAQERPFDPGGSPVTPAQVDALAALCAALLGRYGLRPVRANLLTHAEIPEAFGVPQAGKWDIRWLPGMDFPGSALAVGDMLRAKVAERIAQ